jgi:hypothetical protein
LYELDPRWPDDPREDDEYDRDLSRGSRGGADDRDRSLDPRDVFMNDLDLPRGPSENTSASTTTVARQSGVCVMRQYAAFAGIVFGQKTRKFFAKLEHLGYVSTYDCAHNRARIYHVRHRELYEAIGEPESRLRRPPAVPRALERLMVLDAILVSPDIVWLSTSQEKVEHLTTLTRIPLDDLPHLASGINSLPTSSTLRADLQQPTD